MKNSGIIEGPFLRRNKYKNVDKNNEWITPTDLGIGADVKINGYSYHVVSCDDYTKSYLQAHLDWVPDLFFAANDTATLHPMQWIAIYKERSISTLISFKN